jgi:glucose-6-phosphate isomerase
VLADLDAHPGQLREAAAIAASCGLAEKVETVFHVLEHRAANPAYGAIQRTEGEAPCAARFGRSRPA